MEQINGVTGPDQSFQQFLSRLTDADEGAKRIATLYVQGFHAGRAELISVHSLKKLNEAADQINGDQAFRIVGGYDQLPQWFYDHAVSGGTRFQFNAIVKEIHWRKNSVHAILMDGTELHASCALITLPLPALQSRSVRFVPDLVEKSDAANRLAMGQVVRCVFTFRERFWEDLKLHTKEEGGSLFDMGFLHAPDELIPTWWTQLPLRVPMLVGWTGGPNAERLLTSDPDHIMDRALDSLQRTLQIPRKLIDDQLEGSYMHDWFADTFSAGAYSYIPLGGMDACAQLAQPVEDTLFFAGEATNTDGHIGTVHGAIATGKRAAKEIIARS